VFRVSATWSTHANRATDAPFTVLDGATALATIDLNQELPPNDFTEQGTAWENVGGTHLVSGSTLTVRLTNDANEFVIADAVRIKRLGSASSGPEIQVLDGAADVVSGSGSVSFGHTTVGTAVSRTFTIKNVGAANLTLQPASAPGGFTVVTNIAANTVLAPQAQTQFTVRFDAAASASGVVSLGNSDADENPFRFTVTGTAGAAPTTVTIDNGDAGYASTGFTLFTGQGHLGDVAAASSGTGGKTATWTFSGLVPGQYRVSATWTTHSNRATDAPFTIFDGAAPLGTVDVNQEAAPNDRTADGSAWEDLGGPYTLSGTSLIVQLTDDADEYVLADAVRIERLSGGPAAGPAAGPAPAAIQIIDDAAAGFTSTGFTPYTGQGRDNDVHYSAAGSGGDTATWTFTVSPGVYQVSATWSTHGNRATNAPYSISDGATLLATAAVNQQLAPNDLTDQGSSWEHLGGTYTITGATLTVRLTDAANGFVIADALRIERLADLPAPLVDQVFSDNDDLGGILR
jgi:hypothetical protein